MKKAILAAAMIGASALAATAQPGPGAERLDPRDGEPRVDPADGKECAGSARWVRESGPYWRIPNWRKKSG